MTLKGSPSTGSTSSRQAGSGRTGVRVRFAPSPTGILHIGNVRTALFNWLFARHEGGEFLLRIEDTDKARSEKRHEKEILEGLKWLGLEWDNKKLIRQSERTEIYKKYLEELLQKNAAYYCFCSAEGLEAERQAQLSQGLLPKYGGKCRHLDPKIAAKKTKSEPAVIRFKTPTTQAHFQDMVRGKVAYNGELLGDIIIAKGLDEPLYNFAVVVDDHDMEITHVIRGEDHLSNTQKQIFIQEALGFERPHYAHLPLILGSDRKKLSKRHLDKSLLDYKKSGYLWEAMVNFLVLLGWHPIQDREIISMEDVIKEFTLERVQKGGAVFNPEKLDWLNSFYIKEASNEKILESIKLFIPASWLKKKDFLLKVFSIEKPRIKNLSEFSGIAGFFFELPEYSPEMLIWKKTPKDKIKSNLEKILEILGNQENVRDAQEAIARIAEEEGRGEVFWPLRVALSGRDASPGPLEIVDVLGIKEATIRIREAVKKL